MATYTTLMTPLNPFLALEALLQSNTYVSGEFSVNSSFMARWWRGSPVGVFCWLSVLISVSLMLFSTLRLRVIGAKIGQIPWYRRVLGLGAVGAMTRQPRKVSKNPISWREGSSHTLSVAGVLGRWSFIIAGIAVACVMARILLFGWNDDRGICASDCSRSFLRR